MIETTQQLEELMQRAQTTDAVGLDTEFVWERTYFPRLGLIQLALPEEECFLIDPLAIKDLSSLGELLSNPSVVKIFHDGSQDLGILRKATGVDPENIFDTRLAAGFAGKTSILSLLALVDEYLGITLNKTQTRTNWLKRPLTSNQMKYGLDDVKYLRSVRRLILADVLPESFEWLNEELSKLDDPKSYMGLDDNMRYTKVKGANRLNRPSLAVLCGLADWRENEARQRNKPRGHIIRDEVLLYIASGQLVDVSALHQCEGISEKSIGRYGNSMIKIVASTLAQPDTSYPTLLRMDRLSKTEESLLRKFQDFIRTKCEQYGMDPALLGNKAELKAFIKKSTAPARQKEGWRKEFLAGFTL